MGEAPRTLAPVRQLKRARIKPGRDQDARLRRLGELLKEGTRARVDGLTQAVLTCEGLRRRGGQADGASYHVRGLLVVLIVGEVARVHSVVSEQDALESVEDK